MTAPIGTEVPQRSVDHLRDAAAELRYNTVWSLGAPDPHAPGEGCQDCKIERLSGAVADWLEWMADRAASGNEIPGMRGNGLAQALVVADVVMTEVKS